MTKAEVKRYVCRSVATLLQDQLDAGADWIFREIYSEDPAYSVVVRERTVAAVQDLRAELEIRAGDRKLYRRGGPR